MREIKFRAWDINSGKYVEDTTNYYLRLADHNVFIADDRVLFKNVTSKVIIEQYTGVEDIYGNEIYEGDIVGVFNDGVDVITFINGCFGTAPSYVMEFVPMNDIHGYYEIIGNIHENPELLEGE